MRNLMEADAQGHAGARIAIELFSYCARKYLGAYLAMLGGADAVVFGGVSGEHAPSVRVRISEGMDWCGLVLDSDANVRTTELAPGRGARISRPESRLAVYVVAVDEESWIVRETARRVP